MVIFGRCILNLALVGPWTLPPVHALLNKYPLHPPLGSRPSALTTNLNAPQRPSIFSTVLLSWVVDFYPVLSFLPTRIPYYIPSFLPYITSPSLYTSKWLVLAVVPLARATPSPATVARPASGAIFVATRPSLNGMFPMVRVCKKCFAN